MQRSEGLRAEVARSNVHVVTVYPGPVRSAMEDAGRSAFDATAAARYVPTGDSDVLAALVLAAVKKKRPRVIDPKSYAVARWFPGTTRWLTDRLTPQLKRLPG